MSEFEKRNVQVIGCSVDSKWAHHAWKNTDVNKGGIGNVKYPIIADIDKSVARAFDVLMAAKPATVITEEDEMETTVGGSIAVRGSFLIDENGVVRHSVINDLPLGRNIDEMLRMVDALAHHQEHGEVCPANWTQGEKSMTPNQEGLKTYFEKQKLIFFLYPHNKLLKKLKKLQKFD